MNHIFKHALAAGLLVSLVACGESAEKAPEGEKAAGAEKIASAPTALELRRKERIVGMVASFDEGISFKDHYNALDPRLKRSGITRGSMFNAADDYWGLPRTPGYEEVASNCAACHSLSIVMQQHVTADRWDYLLKWMVDKQGMMAMEPEDDILVRAYLNKHFSPDAK